jgi:hypothetical protein
LFRIAYFLGQNSRNWPFCLPFPAIGQRQGNAEWRRTGQINKSKKKGCEIRKMTASRFCLCLVKCGNFDKSIVINNIEIQNYRCRFT